MSLLIKNKKFQILIFSIACTIIILILNKNIDINLSNKISFNLRNLISSDDVDNRCKNTEKNFLSKYKATNFSNVEDEKLTKYQETLQEIIINKDYKKIKDYLLRIVIYLGFLALDIFLIILWCGLWGCLCCYKDKSYATGCSRCVFSFYTFLNVVVIFICVFGYFSIPSFYKSVNGVICSLYKTVFHFIEGTKSDFSNNNWKGVEGIKQLINIYDQIDKEFKELPTSDKITSDCNDGAEYCEKYLEFKNKIQENNNTEFINELSKSEQYINNVSSFFVGVRDEQLKHLENYMEYFDKYCKLGLLCLFAAILIFCLLELLIVIAYFICKCNCTSCLFHLFWNIEMIIIITNMLIGIGLGILGVLSKDIVSIFQYAKTSENLEKASPFLFHIEENYKNSIDRCFNGNGDLSRLAFKSNKIFDESNNKTYQEFEEFYSKSKDILKNKEKLSNAYKSLYQVLKNLKELYDELNEKDLKKIFNCEFIKFDFDILIDELNKSLSKKLVLLSLIIIIADIFALFSIMLGIIIVTKYKGQNKPEMPKKHLKYFKYKGNNPNIDISSENLRK